MFVEKKLTCIRKDWENFPLYCAVNQIPNEGGWWFLNQFFSIFSDAGQFFSTNTYFEQNCPNLLNISGTKGQLISDWENFPLYCAVNQIPNESGWWFLNQFFSIFSDAGQFFSTNTYFEQNCPNLLNISGTKGQLISDWENFPLYCAVNQIPNESGWWFLHQFTSIIRVCDNHRQEVQPKMYCWACSRTE